MNEQEKNDILQKRLDHLTSSPDWFDNLEIRPQVFAIREELDPDSFFNPYGKGTRTFPLPKEAEEEIDEIFWVTSDKKSNSKNLDTSENSTENTRIDTSGKTTRKDLENTRENNVIDRSEKVNIDDLDMSSIRGKQWVNKLREDDQVTIVHLEFSTIEPGIVFCITMDHHIWVQGNKMYGFLPSGYSLDYSKDKTRMIRTIENEQFNKNRTTKKD
ncbi:hypothetical protein ACQKTA_13365 (plasmid) [Enterococcus sp. 22-H-5-01]|uniref:hypothetical protein n=1 Tax=Enterococcus sp. 22-H-5-01 TaxID=3418555 RepID=UPI003D03CC4C